MISSNMIDWQLNEFDKQLINIAFAEDFGMPYLDITTQVLFPETQTHTKASIISKHSASLVLCGMPVVQAILEKLNDKCHIHSQFREGDPVPPGAQLMQITGPASSLLMAERTILNFLQRLCAIATMTRLYVDAVRHTQVKILDTRKTLPGFRHLEKYAVQCGGGMNHRMGLYDAIMIKDTHVDALGGMQKAMAALPQNITQQYPVIIEVRTMQELQMVLENHNGKVTHVLLDNMTPALMRECVLICKNVMPLEASGNISLNNVAEVAETGVDFISIGKITHSAGSVDLSMKCE